MSKKASTLKANTVIKIKKDTTTKSVKQVKNIEEALFNFQSEDINIPRNGNGSINGREYKYAILDDINKIIKPFLQKHRLVITQLVENTKLVTKIIHVDSGTFLLSPLPFVSPRSAQDLGSQITYLRRYGIVSALNLIVDQDIDGLEPAVNLTQDNAQEQAPQQNKATPTTVENNSPAVSEAYNKAHQAIMSASSQEALEMLAGQLDRSTRLSDTEKATLKKILEDRDTEIHGTVR